MEATFAANSRKHHYECISFGINSADPHLLDPQQLNDLLSNMSCLKA